ncbi:leucine-rich repeat domain-containing protein [Candidatus Saccharibacteria bacterium]|nr:leucine-rich repeat domain-containing protein [Candidatus Saccharibacteria bacterium]
MEEVLEALDALPRDRKCIQLFKYSFDTYRITEFPLVLLEFKDLEHLDISNTNIKVIPPEIGQLTKLRKLHLDFNEFDKLPPEIGQLTELRVLSLDHNKLRGLPDEICNLTNLCSLDCEFNKISSLPKNIGNLVNLKKLNALSNNLTTLPISLCTLPECKVDLYFNDIETLPMVFKQLTKVDYGTQRGRGLYNTYVTFQYEPPMTFQTFIAKLQRVLQ